MRTATVYNFLLEANLMASIAIVLMLVIRKCFRKQLGNRAIYFAWLLIAIRLLCPLALPNPAINQIRSSNAVDVDIRPIPGQIKVRFADMSQDIYRLAKRATGDKESSPLSHALDAFVDDNYDGSLSYTLMLIYAAGACATLCWFLAANLRFRHRLKADRIEPISGKLLKQYKTLCVERGVAPVPVYFTDPLPSACLVGTFRPYIALPLTAKPSDAIHVLTHEISHVKGRDNLWALLRLLCCVIHWFNPLVWLAAEMSRTDGELACDDRAVAALDNAEKRSYANVLVLAAARRNAPGVAVLATGMTMTGRKLKTRVNAILHHSQVKKGFVISFVLLAGMALVGAFATAEYKSWPAVPVFKDVAGLEARSITDNESAVAYAKEIWASPYLNRAAQGVNEETVSWEAFHYTNGGERYEVISSAPGALDSSSVEFEPNGTILRLRNGDCGASRAVATASLYGDEYPEQRDELCAFLRSALEQLFPGEAGAVTGFRNIGDGDYSNGSQHFASFHAATADNPYAYSLEMQTVPVVRLVSCYNDNRGQ